MAYLIKGAHVVDPQVGLDDVRDVLVRENSVTRALSTRRPSPPGRVRLPTAASPTLPPCPTPTR